MARWHHFDGAIKEPSRPMAGDHVVIIGPYGNVWHDNTFRTAEAAEEYLRAFWAGTDSFEPHRWRLACACVTIEAIAPSFKLPSASGMSTETAKTPKAVEGQSPASPVANGETPKA